LRFHGLDGLTGGLGRLFGALLCRLDGLLKLLLSRFFLLCGLLARFAVGVAADEQQRAGQCRSKDQ